MTSSLPSPHFPPAAPSSRFPARALALGTAAGLRSQMPLALLALSAQRGQLSPQDHLLLSPLRSKRVQSVLGLLAVGELIGDKLPFTPSRLEGGPLLGRLGLGALSGAVLARSSGSALLSGALLGAAGAALGATLGYHARAALTRHTEIPDAAWALLEDAVALGLGLLALTGNPTGPEAVPHTRA